MKPSTSSGSTDANCLPWDGSYLPEITDDNILEVIPLEKYSLRGKIWTLRLQIPYAKSPRRDKKDPKGDGGNAKGDGGNTDDDGKTIQFTCYRRSLTNSYPILVDELKPIFDLQKVGTHRVMYNNKLYMIQRLTLINPSETLKKDLDSATYTSIRTEVQDIYAFRSAMAMAINSDSCINLVRRGNLSYPVSFYDTYPFFTSVKKSLPSTVLRRWFDKEDLPSVYRRLLRVPSLESYPEKLATLRNQIMEVCERVDSTLIIRCCLIVERISDQLIQSFLTAPHSGSGAGLTGSPTIDK